LVVLKEDVRDASGRKLARLIHLHEEAAGVLADIRPDPDDIGDTQVKELHGQRPPG
jgi:hypothetical protein